MVKKTKLDDLTKVHILVDYDTPTGEPRPTVVTKISLREIVEANRIFGEKFKDDRDEYVGTDMLPMYEATQGRLKPAIDKLFFYVNKELDEQKPLMLGVLAEGSGYMGDAVDNVLLPSSPILRIEAYDLKSSYTPNNGFCFSGLRLKNQKSNIFDGSESGWGNKRIEIAVAYKIVTNETWDKKGKHTHTIVDYRHVSRDIKRK
ncbi:hypothetical protein ACFL0E_00215 [Nanoarchaeota archaeon]